MPSLDALAQAARVGDEEVVADELDLAAELAGQQLPAVPIVLGHAVLDRDDRDSARRGRRNRRPCPAASSALPSPSSSYLPSLKNSVAAGSRPSTTSSPGLVAGRLDRLHDEAERLVGRARLGANPPSSPTLVLCPASCSASCSAWKISEPMRIASATRRRADRQDHEFLDVDRIVGMDAAIDDVHHRHRQRCGRRRRRHSGRAAGPRSAADGLGARRG